MSLRILIVDDDPVTRHLVRSMLESAHHEVIVCETAQSALDALSSKTTAAEMPQLLLVDNQIGSVTGAELLTQIRRLELCRALPVIMLSANSEAEVRTVYPSLDLQAFLEKPFTGESLLAIINLVLERFKK